jgi:hypothetical protein
MTKPVQAEDHAGRLVYVSVDGPLTEPRSYGVYRVDRGRGSESLHFGNHPVRQWELERKYGAAELVRLFLDRDAADELKKRLSSR